MFLRLSSGLAATLLLLALTASSALRKDRPRPGPLVRLDHLMDQGIPPLLDFQEQEKGDALVRAWLKAGAPPDPQASVFGYSCFQSRYDQFRLRLEDGGEVEAAVTDLDASPFLFHIISLGAGMPDVAGYGLSDQGLLVYDHVGKRWGWIPIPREAGGNCLRDVESDLLKKILSFREDAVVAGIPDGGDGPGAIAWVGPQSLPFNRPSKNHCGRVGSSDGSLSAGSPIWPIAIFGDDLLAVPGEASPRNLELYNPPGPEDLSSQGYSSWHPRHPVWIHWREDGPVPGSKRILIRIGDF